MHPIILRLAVVALLVACADSGTSTLPRCDDPAEDVPLVPVEEEPRVGRFHGTLEMPTQGTELRFTLDVSRPDDAARGCRDPKTNVRFELVSEDGLLEEAAATSDNDAQSGLQVDADGIVYEDDSATVDDDGYLLATGMSVHLAREPLVSGGFLPPAGAADLVGATLVIEAREPVDSFGEERTPWRADLLARYSFESPVVVHVGVGRITGPPDGGS